MTVYDKVDYIEIEPALIKMYLICSVLIMSKRIRTNVVILLFRSDAQFCYFTTFLCFLFLDYSEP